MITDPTGRYFLTALDDSTLWRYDLRWRRTKTYRPTDGRAFEYREGFYHFLLIVRDGERIEATVRQVARPDEPLAVGTFDGKWTFGGDNQAWQHVPEHLIISQPETSLLRIADQAEPLALQPLDHITRVDEVPESRLLILTGDGYLTAFDPKTSIAGYRFKLANGHRNPSVRFRKEGKELWLDDVDTLMKIETKTWSPVDGAGSESSGIGSWTLSADENRAVVVRPEGKDALVLSADSMELVDAAEFDSTPIDAAISGNWLIAAAPDGTSMRVRLGKSARA